ncbi:MAG TPA: TetR/AcrR family transcriptional regulator [Pseudonocardia sp.]
MAKPRGGVTQRRQRRAARSPNQLSDVREAALSLFAERGYRSTGVRDIADLLGIGATSVYSHVRSKGELLREIVIGTMDAVLLDQADAIASTEDVVEQLRRAAESQIRYFTRFPREAIVTTRDFSWADPEDLPEILEKRRVFRGRIEELLVRGTGQGRFQPKNPKIGAFAIIEMCEAVPIWFRPDGELSEASVAYLYGEYAVRLAGATPPLQP